LPTGFTLGLTNEAPVQYAIKAVITPAGRCVPFAKTLDGVLVNNLRVRNRMANLFLLAAIWAVPTIALSAPILKKQRPSRDRPASKAMFLKRVRSPVSWQLSLVQQECFLAATAFTFE